MRQVPKDLLINSGSVARQATNVSLSAVLVAEAKSRGISVSRACERGLAEEIAEARAAEWLDENREAIESWNSYVEAHGLPLARFRQF